MFRKEIIVDMQIIINVLDQMIAESFSYAAIQNDVSKNTAIISDRLTLRFSRNKKIRNTIKI